MKFSEIMSKDEKMKQFLVEYSTKSRAEKAAFRALHGYSTVEICRARSRFDEEFSNNQRVITSFLDVLNEELEVELIKVECTSYLKPRVSRLSGRCK